jgi:hypothetical protein
MAKGTKTGGRKAGVPNRITREFRETVRIVLEANADNVGVWLDKVAADDPGRALNLMSKLAEYATPKLARSEHTGPDGGPMQVNVNDPTRRANRPA